MIHFPLSCTLHALGQEPTGDGCPFGHHQGRFPDWDDEGFPPDGTFVDAALSDVVMTCKTESRSIGLDVDDEEDWVDLEGERD